MCLFNFVWWGLYVFHFSSRYSKTLVDHSPEFLLQGFAILFYLVLLLCNSKSLWVHVYHVDKPYQDWTINWCFGIFTHFLMWYSVQIANCKSSITIFSYFLNCLYELCLENDLKTFCQICDSYLLDHEWYNPASSIVFALKDTHGLKRLYYHVSLKAEQNQLWGRDAGDLRGSSPPEPLGASLLHGSCERLNAGGQEEGWRGEASAERGPCFISQVQPGSWGADDGRKNPLLFLFLQHHRH